MNGCNTGGVSASTLCQPTGVAVDSSGNVYVADLSNNRVLEYSNPLATDTVADQVFGQGGSFTTNVPNNGGPPSAAGLNFPSGVAVDPSGNLYVADPANNRVLGQSNFSSNSCNQGTTPSASTLCGPDGVAVDNVGNVYVADQNNHRVLEYDYPLPPADLDGDGVPDPLDVCPGTAPGATVDAT